MDDPRTLRPAVAFAVLVGVLYGIVARVVFEHRAADDVLRVMMFSFIFVVPVVVGFLTTYLAGSTRYLHALFMPWLTAGVSLLALMALNLEGAICIVMMVPVYLPMASLGGLLGMGMRRWRRGRLNAAGVGAVLLLPYLVAPAESALPLAMQRRVVENQVRIRAGADEVWSQIIRVPPIDAGQYGTSFVHRIGFPRPVEATLSREGVGGVRHASFERGVVFVETVTAWEPRRLLSFGIDADPASIPASTFDQHVTVGGEFFDVLDGTYEIEPVGPGEVILHLRSTHRLSTTFNFYASFWTDLVMRQIQGNILRIVKARSEAAA
jgi:hypothetical protein